MPRPAFPTLYIRDRGISDLTTYQNEFCDGRSPHEILEEFDTQSEWVDALFMYFVIINVPVIIVLYALKYFIFGDVSYSIAGFTHLMYTTWSILFISGSLIYRTSLRRKREKLAITSWFVEAINTYKNYLYEKKDVETVIEEIQKLNETERTEVYNKYFKVIYNPINQENTKTTKVRWKDIDLVSDKD